MKSKFILHVSLIIYVSIAFLFFQSLTDKSKDIQTNQVEINLQRERGISMHNAIEQKKLSVIYNTEPQLLKDFESLENKEIQQKYLKLLSEKTKYSDHENFEKYTVLMNVCTKDIFGFVINSKNISIDV